MRPRLRQGELKRTFGFANETLPIEWLPDGTGWLIHGEQLIEKKSGKILLTVPPNPGEWGKGNRRYLDPETQIVVKEAGGARSLELVRIKRDEVDVALKIAAEGGDPMASRLPPLAKTSLAGVKQLNPPQDRVGWKLAVEPAKERMPGANVPLRAALTDIEELCLAPGHAAVVSLVAAEEGAMRSKVRVETFNLKNGGAGKEVELFQASDKMGSMDHLSMPHTARFLADLSNDGSRFALREPAEKTRVDVWTMPAGKHVVGLAPFTGDVDPKIAWFGLVDDLLLTASARRLVAWKIPEGKAIYSLTGDFVPGSFAFSPNRVHLVVMAGPNVYALDPRTGMVEGQMPFPDEVDVPRVASVCFRPDGKALAALTFRIERHAAELQPRSIGVLLRRRLPADSLEARRAERAPRDHAPAGAGPGPVARRRRDHGRHASSRMVDGRKPGDDQSVLDEPDPNRAATLRQPLLVRRRRLRSAGSAARVPDVAGPGVARIAKAVRDKSVALAFGPGVPIQVLTEGSIPAPAVEQLKKSLEARKFTLGDGGATLRIRLTEGGGESIRIREMPGNRITTVAGLSITGEATLSDAKGEIWKTNYKNGTSQGFGMVRANDLTTYFHKPIRDGAENWVRSLPLPRGVVRDGAKLIPYPNVIKLVGD